MSAVRNPPGPAVDAETPVRQVMQMLSEGAESLSVTEGGLPVGRIAAPDVMARLIDPQGSAARG